MDKSLLPLELRFETRISLSRRWQVGSGWWPQKVESRAPSGAEFG